MQWLAETFVVTSPQTIHINFLVNKNDMKTKIEN